MIGVLKEPQSSEVFLSHLKDALGLELIKYTPYSKTIKKVAICGGSGSFLLKSAISQGADAFVTGDIKYHDFFMADSKLLLADVGHYESEQFTKEIFYELLTKKFTKFAVHLSEVNTNPVNYF
jgi:putative NIF3 family GTP cyclohydrolase 1 type 2